jgi:hypothetical protein
MKPSELAARRLAWRLAVGAGALALGVAHAADTRSACALHPASGDVVSQAADAMSLNLSATQPSALANWDVRWWERHRAWIALTATNNGDAPAHLLPQLLVDARADGGAALVQVGLPITLAAGASTAQRMTIYIPDDAKTLGVRVLDALPAAPVSIRFALECSDSRYDAGEMAKPAAAGLEAALAQYFADFEDPISAPHDALVAAQALASGAQDAGDVAWALRGLMQAVRDDHGFVAAPGEPLPVRRMLVTRAPAFEWRQDGTAVVQLHAAGLLTDADALAWATTVHDGVAALAARHPRAWIVDLRDHEGDNPWAALAGLSTLVGGPAVGATVSRRERVDWIVDRGVVRLAGGPALADLQLGPEPAFEGPVAVLVGPHTRDAGEMVAIAFTGRPHTRSFGSPTGGFPNTGVLVRALADGTRIGVLEMRAADRNGRVYRFPVTPDEQLDPTRSSDTLPHEAIEWVLDERSNGGGNR